jgi:hypothetical protein
MFHPQAAGCPDAGQRGVAFHSSVALEPAPQLATEIGADDPDRSTPCRSHAAEQAACRGDRHRRFKPVTGFVAHHAARCCHAITLANDQRRKIHAFCPLHVGTAPARGRTASHADAAAYTGHDECRSLVTGLPAWPWRTRDAVGPPLPPLPGRLLWWLPAARRPGAVHPQTRTAAVGSRVAVLATNTAILAPRPIRPVSGRSRKARRRLGSPRWSFRRLVVPGWAACRAGLR